MKHLNTLIIASYALMTACTGKKLPQVAPGLDSINTMQVMPDTAIYGTIGDGTTMHMLELISIDGQKKTFSLDVDITANIQGGLFVGDRISITATKTESGDMAVTQLINLTTLLGKWISIDRNFEIKDDGEVVSTVKAETKPYTQWGMYNGHLILGTDTFSVLSLSSDSLLLESGKGIYAYKRIKK